MTEDDLEHIQKVQEHISNVRRNCTKLAENLLKDGHSQLYLELISAAQIHDNSKLKGIEFTCLRPKVKEDKPELFLAALRTHWAYNSHHPEHHINGVSDMSESELAEMVCDWKSRSDEMGTSFLEWVKKDACDKYKISKKGRVWPKIKKYADFLLEEKFK